MTDSSGTNIADIVMKVLHAVDVYLRVSENWVFPQIHCVPGVTPGILCSSVENTDQFPLKGAALLLDPPPWNRNLGLPRLLNSLFFRAGYPALAATRTTHRWNPQILHAHFGMRGWNMLPVKRRLQIPMITSFYGIDAWSLPEQAGPWRTRYQDLFRQGDGFIAEGPAMADRLRAIGCPPDKIHVVRIGVDLERLPLPERKPSSVPRVLMLARFTEKKGLPDGLRACLEALRQGVDFRVTIAGDATPGDGAGMGIGSELRDIASAREFENRLSFTGFVPAARSRQLMSEHDIYLCPSRHARNGDAEGGSPVSLTEAMALGMACIGTRHCDIPEVIRHGETGWLAESGDITGLATHLADAIKHPEKAGQLALRGRSYIESNFSIATQINSLERIYAHSAGPLKS